MFKNIHLRLTLLNTVILVIFLIVLSIILYTFMDKLVTKGIDESLKVSSYHVNDLDELPKFPPLIRNDGNENEEKRPRSAFERMQFKYILRDEKFNVKKSSEVDQEVLKLTEKYAIETKDIRKPIFKELEINGEKVRLLSVSVKKNDQRGVVQVFRSIELEKKILSYLMTILVGLILIGATLAILAGWFLAGKAIIPINKSFQQQKDFVADASHELRTPLTIIQTNLEVALSNPDSTIAENKKWLSNAHLESQKMSRLVHDLLLLAKIDVGQISFDKKEFSLSATAHEVVEQMKPLFQNEDLGFSQTIDEGIMINGDETRIRQLMYILLDNAIKYTPSKGKVDFKVIRNKEKIELSIEDTGIGISEEDKELIFNRFYRVDKARSRQQGGSGLGLSIADWIVENHKGQIKVESVLEKGSRFSVELPSGC